MYLIVRLIVCVVQALPARLAYKLADNLAWLIYSVAKRRREIASENFAAAFPEMASDHAAIDQLVRGMFTHFVRAAIELVLVSRKLTLNTWRRHVVLADGGKILPPLLADRAALIVTGHLGNWELAASAWACSATTRTPSLACRTTRISNGMCVAFGNRPGRESSRRTASPMNSRLL